MQPSQPKLLEPDVTVRRSTEYRKEKNVLKFSTWHLKFAYSAQTLYVAEFWENFGAHACCQHDTIRSMGKFTVPNTAREVLLLNWSKPKNLPRSV